MRRKGLERIFALLKDLFSGVLFMGTVDGLKTLVMFLIAGILIYLAIKKDYEPALLLPIAFGAILANLPPIIDAVTGDPAASVLGSEGFLTVLFNAGIANELFPILIFIAVGAMIDFSPLLKGSVDDLLRRGGAVWHLRHLPGLRSC